MNRGFSVSFVMLPESSTRLCVSSRVCNFQRVVSNSPSATVCRDLPSEISCGPTDIYQLMGIPMRIPHNLGIIHKCLLSHDFFSKALARKKLCVIPTREIIIACLGWGICRRHFRSFSDRSLWSLKVKKNANRKYTASAKRYL